MTVIHEPNWTYEEAFCRNLGLISCEEQEQLRSSCVAIAGMGGVGGLELVTLARLGVGKFVIADPDRFEVANTNRQYGATVLEMGRLKSYVMWEVVKNINPGIDIRIFTDPIGSGNVGEFLEGVDVFVDGIDAFEIPARRVVFRSAADRGIFALSAGPIGFGTAWVIFDPDGMSFDEYFDLSDGMDECEMVSSFLVGMDPELALLNSSYMDLSYIDYERRTGPSASPACFLAAGVVGVEVLKILLKRGFIHAAPYLQQFNSYLGKFDRRTKSCKL